MLAFLCSFFWFWFQFYAITLLNVYICFYCYNYVKGRKTADYSKRS